jgi:hypothetical protein
MIQGRPRRLVEVFKVPYVRGVLNDDYFRQPYVLKEMRDGKGDELRVQVVRVDAVLFHMRCKVAAAFAVDCDPAGTSVAQGEECRQS